jgi:SNF2 family DNA or RNA helicase
MDSLRSPADTLPILSKEDDDDASSVSSEESEASSEASSVSSSVSSEESEDSSVSSEESEASSVSSEESEEEFESPIITPRDDIHLLPHQLEAVKWMLEREKSDAEYCQGGILADDMGLGKTLTTIALLKNGLSVPSLIVCPPALLSAWTSELRACGFIVREHAQSGSWTVLKAGDPQLPSDFPKGFDELLNKTIWVTTYPKLALYYPSMVDQFLRVILDEGHCIRNAGTDRFYSCRRVADCSMARWILSATPVQNSEKDWKTLCS